MHYEFVAIPDDQVPEAADPLFQHLVTTYASETNKTAGMWRTIPDDLLDYRPHEKTNNIRAILVHQILSERRFFAQFVGAWRRLAVHGPPRANAGGVRANGSNRPAGRSRKGMMRGRE